MIPWTSNSCCGAWPTGTRASLPHPDGSPTFGYEIVDDERTLLGLVLAACE